MIKHRKEYIMKNCKTKLYNVLFPVWMLMMFPVMWLIILPGNFIIDSLVLLITMKILNYADKKMFYKKHILKIFLFGMLADIIGALFIFLMMYIFEIGNMGDELYLTIPGLLIAGLMIFIFNYFITFKKLDKKERLRLSLIFAIITAPYTYLIPTSWIYY